MPRGRPGENTPEGLQSRRRAGVKLAVISTVWTYLAGCALRRAVAWWRPFSTSILEAMNTPAPATPAKPPRPPLPRHRRRGPRALAFSLILLVIMSVFSLYTNGYGVLTGSRQETTEDGKMILKRCAYFTGKETVINHVMRAATDKRGAPRCELVKKVYMDPTETQPQMQPQNPGPIIEIKPDSAPTPAPPPAEPKKEP